MDGTEAECVGRWAVIIWIYACALGGGRGTRLGCRNAAGRRYDVRVALLEYGGKVICVTLLY